MSVDSRVNVERTPSSHGCKAKAANITANGGQYSAIRFQRAVMESGWSNSLLDLTDRAEALRAVRSSPEFLSILDSAKRIANITGNAASGSIAPALLQHPTEKRLAKLADSVSEQIDGLIGSRQYRAAFESFAGMAPELEKFFVDVLVMVEDEKLRSNRMALLRKVGSAVSKIADVTKVVVDRSEYAPTA